jgi:hypothetical protein
MVFIKVTNVNSSILVCLGWIAKLLRIQTKIALLSKLLQNIINFAVESFDTLHTLIVSSASIRVLTDKPCC